MRPDHWFPAKRYGWGWGAPVRWEGWAVIVAFFALMILGVAIFPPQTSMFAFAGYFVVLNIVLTVVCWWKGETPRWRWGARE